MRPDYPCSMTPRASLKNCGARSSPRSCFLFPYSAHADAAPPATPHTLGRRSPAAPVWPTPRTGGSVINPRHRLQLGPVGQVEAADHIHLIELQGRGRGSHPNQVDRSRRSVVRDEGWHADLTQQLSDPDLAPRREGQRGRLQGPRPRPPPCSRLLAAGRRDLRSVMDRMGHHQIQTTQKYLHALPEADRKNLDALERISQGTNR
jgi:hypothetical protein